MKTVLDLIGEFAALNDAKVAYGGELPPESEKRWRELKGFYDLLMASRVTGEPTRLSTRSTLPRVSPSEVMARVTARDRLRVPFESELVLKFRDQFHDALAVNVSRGGLFVSSKTLLPARSSLTVFLSSPHPERESLLEAPGRVAWVTESGIGGIPKGMGVSLKGKRDRVVAYLDSLVVEALVEQLSGLDLNGFAPEALLGEHIEL
jgi:Tfp pilus assembly protein PilZ